MGVGRLVDEHSKTPHPSCSFFPSQQSECKTSSGVLYFSRLNDWRGNLKADGSTSALARNDPTLLAKSDPAPPTRGCRICRSTRKDHARVLTAVRARSAI